MKNLNKQAILCNQLNLNFEEANELFEEESLESMQMARVNGGAIITLSTIAAVAAIISAVAGVVAVTYTILSEEKLDPATPTEAPVNDEVIRKMVDDLKTTGGELHIDSMIGNNIYGVKYIIHVNTPGQ